MNSVAVKILIYVSVTYHKNFTHNLGQEGAWHGVVHVVGKSWILNNNAWDGREEGMDGKCEI